jgi:hypothetical protein
LVIGPEQCADEAYRIGIGGAIMKLQVSNLWRIWWEKKEINLVFLTYDDHDANGTLEKWFRAWKPLTHTLVILKSGKGTLIIWWVGLERDDHDAMDYLRITGLSQ